MALRVSARLLSGRVLAPSRSPSSPSPAPPAPAPRRWLHVWLRAESKPHEQRTLLLPEHVRLLKAEGHTVTVEASSQRCVPISAYAAIPGVRVAEEGAWRSAPPEALVCGLKELPDEPRPLTHHHLFFAHAYKGQKTAPALLRRFAAGGGVLWDLEYLVDGAGRRVAAFWAAAGQAGMAVGLLAWAWQQRLLAANPAPAPNAAMPPLLDTFPTFADLAAHVKAALAPLPRRPSVHVVGARGRVGSGAVRFAQRFSLPLTTWGHDDTRDKRGPFPELLQSDIFVNAILLQPTAPPMTFLTLDMLQLPPPQRRLSVIADVSCDPYNPLNPLPVYSEATTLEVPSVRVAWAGGLPVDVVAIDHLPSLVPEESSREFAHDLLPHLLAFPASPVWARARALFDLKTAPYRTQA